MKKYFIFVSIVLFVCSMIGVILPAFFSAKSDLAFAVFVLLVIIFPIISLFLVRKLKKGKSINEKL